MIIIIVLVLIVGAGVAASALSCRLQLKYSHFISVGLATGFGLIASIITAFIVIPLAFAVKDAVIANSDQEPRVRTEVQQLELILPGEYLHYIDSNSSMNELEYKYRKEDGEVSTWRAYVGDSRIVEGGNEAYVEVTTTIEGDGFLIPLIAYKDYVFYIPHE